MSDCRLKPMLEAILRQELDLLNRLSDTDYTSPGQGPYRSSVGMHIRHNSDHFSAFFDGLADGYIDYESRQRHELVQNSTKHAAARIKSHLDALHRTERSHQHPLHIREEDGSAIENCTWLISSYGRELQFLLGHTIHHHAIITFLLKEKGIAFPQGFGVAPSTQRHQAGMETGTTQA